MTSESLVKNSAWRACQAIAYAGTSYGLFLVIAPRQVAVVAAACFLIGIASATLERSALWSLACAWGGVFVGAALSMWYSRFAIVGYDSLAMQEGTRPFWEYLLKPEMVQVQLVTCFACTAWLGWWLLTGFRKLRSGRHPMPARS